MSLQIFEREVDENFKNLTTSMWNVIITLTTVGYGDYYPVTNLGRLIGIITAFWGVFFVSLFVVALMLRERGHGAWQYASFAPQSPDRRSSFTSARRRTTT